MSFRDAIHTLIEKGSIKFSNKDNKVIQVNNNPMKTIGVNMMSIDLSKIKRVNINSYD